MLITKVQKRNEKLMRNFLKFVIYVFIIIIVFNIFSKINYKVRYNKMSNVDNIPEPIQTRTTGEVHKIIGNTDLKIEFLYKYVASGRVILTHNYPQDTIENMLSPKDVGLSWGKLAKNLNRTTVYWALGNRFLSWSTQDMDWIKSTGGMRVVKRSYSNNHLIPDTDETKQKIYDIREDDYIKLEGYLVKVTYQMSDGRTYLWKSSTYRNDSGNHACEVMYVTDVTKLK